MSLIQEFACSDFIYIYIYVDVTDTFSFKTFDTNLTCNVHLNYLEVHLWRYLSNGHTASHVCLMQLQWVVVECIVHVCCIYITNALFCGDKIKYTTRVHRCCH